MIQRARTSLAAMLLLPVLVTAFDAAPAQADSSSPRAVLDDIFGQMDAMCGGDGQGPAYDLDAIAKTYFTPPLVAIVTRDYEQPNALGYDILIDAQDCRTGDLKLSILSEDASSATGRATFKNMGEERIIDLVMTKPGADWKVADVVYHHRSFSLKAQP